MTAPDHLESKSGRYVHANGLDIYYEEHGEGKPLLLIHGGALNGESWQPYLKTFAEQFRVITPDSRGHGRTSNPTGKMSFQLLAEDMVALVEALGLKKVFIYGYSDGGQIALEIGMSRPELLQTLVVGGAHLVLTDGSRKWVRSILGDVESPEVDIERFKRDNPEFAAYLQQIHGPEKWKVLLREIKPMWNSELNYTREAFARVAVPTLVLVGDRDGFVPVEDVVAMYRLLPNAEFAVVPASNHTELISSPEKVAIPSALILDFLLRHSDAADQIASSVGTP